MSLPDWFVQSAARLLNPVNADPDQCPGSAQVGLIEGVLTPDLFAALVLVITATTLAGPVLLRWLWPRGERPPP